MADPAPASGPRGPSETQMREQILEFATSLDKGDRDLLRRVDKTTWGLMNQFRYEGPGGRSLNGLRAKHLETLCGHIEEFQAFKRGDSSDIVSVGLSSVTSVSVSDVTPSSGGQSRSAPAGFQLETASDDNLIPLFRMDLLGGGIRPCIPEGDQPDGQLPRELHDLLMSNIDRQIATALDAPALYPIGNPPQIRLLFGHRSQTPLELSIELNEDGGIEIAMDFGDAGKKEWIIEFPDDSPGTVLPIYFGRLPGRILACKVAGDDTIADAISESIGNSYREQHQSDFEVSAPVICAVNAGLSAEEILLPKSIASRFHLIMMVRLVEGDLELRIADNSARGTCIAQAECVVEIDYPQETWLDRWKRSPYYDHVIEAWKKKDSRKNLLRKINDRIGRQPERFTEGTKRLNAEGGAYDLFQGMEPTRENMIAVYDALRIVERELEDNTAKNGKRKGRGNSRRGGRHTGRAKP